MFALLMPPPPTTRAPFRRQPVLYIGLRDIRTVLATATIPLARTEHQGRAVCMSRSFATAMEFARRHAETGGVLAIDRDKLRARTRLRPHRDQVLCLRTRAAGYDECEERAAHALSNIAPLVLAAWESTAAAGLRARMQEAQAAGFLCADLDVDGFVHPDGTPVDWHALFDEDQSPSAQAA